MLQPDLQYVINSGEGVLNSDGALRRNALVIGVRSFLNFSNAETFCRIAAKATYRHLPMSEVGIFSTDPAVLPAGSCLLHPES
jgi:hypothetical protein